MMPEEVREALRWMKETDECVRESMPGTLDGHALNLAGYIRSLSSPATVEALPEGCPETLAFGHPHGGPMGQMVYPPSLHLATGGCNRMGCTPVEIHPVGTRACLTALTPKEYGPDEIGGAPEGRYLMRRRVHASDRAKAWNRYELFDRDVVAAALSKTLELPSYDRAFGPIPQPPTPPVTNKGNPHA